MGLEEDLRAAQAALAERDTAIAEKDAALKQLNTDLGALRQKQRGHDALVAQLQQDKDNQATALSQARMAGADEARAAMKAEQGKVLALAELRVLAAKRLHDPDDAARYIDQGKIVGADGAFDATAAGAQLDELLTARPYLAGTGAGAPPAPGGPPGPPRGNGDGGTRPPGSTDPDAPFNAVIRQVANRR
jgi:multidrug efflux pump subunit AcrA (membrane-fusion protein)